MIKPLHNKIIFTFLNDAGTDGLFKDETKSGLIIVSNVDDTSKIARWAKVVEVGPLVDQDIKVGMYIMPEPLMYTNKFVYDSMNLWQTDDSKVLITSDELPSKDY